jgi:hypothetical protein
MKTLLTIAVAIFSLNANASFIQVSCSNADATVQNHNGHVKTGVFVEKREYTENRINTELVKLEYKDINVEYTENIKIDSKTSGGCVEGQNSGYYSAEETYVEKIEVVKEDGSEFDDGFANLSQDKKTISATLICKRSMNSMIFCPQD